MLGKHTSGVALSTAEVEHFGDSGAGDVIKHLASQRIQHLGQQILPFRVPFVDCVAHTVLLLHSTRK